VWLQTDGGSVGIGDFANIWAKPFDFLKVDIGQFNGDALVGKIGDTDFHKFTLDQVAIAEGHGIFTRFDARPGFLLSITPIEPLYIGLALPNVSGFGWLNGFAALQQKGQGKTQATQKVKVQVPLGNDEDGNDLGMGEYEIEVPYGDESDTYGNRAREVYEQIQIAAGYKIENIGHVRLGYFGDTKANEANRRVELAFALEAIEGMLLDIGGKFFIPYGEDKDYADPTQINLGFTMGLGDFGIYATLESAFGGMYGKDANSDSKYVPGAEFNLHLIPSYNLGVATIGLELGIALHLAETYDGESLYAEDLKSGTDFGAGFWVQKGLGQGHIKAGLSYTALDVKWGAKDKDAKDLPSGYFRIPIVAEIYFF